MKKISIHAQHCSTKLVLFLLFVMTIFCVALSFFVYTSNLTMLEKRVISEYENRVVDTMDKIDRFLYDCYTEMKLFANVELPYLMESTPEEITNHLIEYRAIMKHYSSLSLFDTGGVLIADTSMSDKDRWRGEGYMEKLRAQKEEVIYGIEMAEDPLQSIFYLASLVKYGDVAKGILVSRVPIIKIYSIIGYIERLGKASGIKVDLVDKEGFRLYSNYNNGFFREDLSNNVRGVQRSLSGEIVGNGREEERGADVIYVFARQRGMEDFKGDGWTLIVTIPFKNAFAFPRELRDKALAISGLLIILVITAVALFAHWMFKPLRLLKDAVAKIGEGTVGIKVQIRSDDEIGDLAHSFNRMSENLEKAYATIQGYSSELEAKIADRTKKLEMSYVKLRETNEELQRSNKEMELASEKAIKAKEEAQEARALAEKKARELEKFNMMAVDREIRMRELKERIAELEEKRKK